jgi:hypothetical protein
MAITGTMVLNAGVRVIGIRGSASVFVPGVLMASLRHEKILCGHLWDMRKYVVGSFIVEFGVD